MPDREGGGLAIPTFRKRTSVDVYFKDIESKTKNCEQLLYCSPTGYSIPHSVTKVKCFLTSVNKMNYRLVLMCAFEHLPETTNFKER